MNNLDTKDKYDIAETIARKWADSVDIDEAISYYFNAQLEYLTDLSDDELMDIAQTEGVKP